MCPTIALSVASALQRHDRPGRSRDRPTPFSRTMPPAGRLATSPTISIRRGVSPPRGRAWNASTIKGNMQRGAAILQNELYAGRLVWNKIRMVKNPDSGKRISRPRAMRGRCHPHHNLRCRCHDLRHPARRISPCRQDLGWSEQSRASGGSRRHARARRFAPAAAWLSRPQIRCPTGTPAPPSHGFACSR